MPFSLLALIIFLIVYAIIAYGVYSSRKMQYDERQKYMQSIAYKYGFFTLILATAVNGFIEYYTKSSWGTPLAESFTIICIGLIVFFTICVFKDAYFSYSETPVKNIVQSIFLFSLIGGINLYTGIMNQQEIISQHSPVKFNNINLISDYYLPMLLLLPALLWNICKKRSSLMKNLRLKAARAALDMSQAELAKRVNVSRQTIVAIEKGDYNPTIKLCIAICHELGKTLDELFWEW